MILVYTEAGSRGRAPVGVWRQSPQKLKYSAFHKKNIHSIFSSFLTQMLINFNNSFTAAFSDELQKKTGIKSTTTAQR